MNKYTYRELGCVHVGKDRDIVISECSNGGFTIATRVKKYDSEGNASFVFLKGALHVDSLSKLKQMEKMLSNAVTVSEEVGSVSEVNWD